jgi:methyl-accepting chemotaxis protein
MSSFLGNMNIGKRLPLGFSIILVSAMGALGMALSQLASVADSTRELLDEPLTTERLVSDWYRMVEAGSRRTLASAKSADPPLGEYFSAEISASSIAINKLQQQIEPHIQFSAEKQIWKEIVLTRADYINVRGKILALNQAGRNEEASELVDRQLAVLGPVYSNHIQDMLNEERRQIDSMAGGIQQAYRTSRALVLALAAPLLAFVALCAWTLNTSITRPLGDAVLVAHRVAAGDLSANRGTVTADETGRLLGALDEMHQQLA